MQAHHTVVTSGPMLVQPNVVMPPQNVINVRAFKGLGITNIVMGIISVGFGITTAVALSSYWISIMSGGIWCGIWFIICGSLGVACSTNPSNTCLIGTTMAFNIIATVLCFIDGVLFLIGLIYTTDCSYDYYNYNYNYNYDYTYSSSYSYARCGFDHSLGTGLFTILMIIMIAQFFVTLIAAIFCCNGCCGSRPSQGVIVQRQQPNFQVVTSSTGQQVMVSVPPGTYPSTMHQGYQTSVQPQYNQQPDQGPVYTAQAPIYQGGITNVAYSEQVVNDGSNVPYSAQVTNDNAPLIDKEPNAPKYSDPAPPPYSQY